MDINRLIVLSVKVSTFVGILLSVWAAVTLFTVAIGGVFEVLGTRPDLTTMIYGIFLLIFGSKLANGSSAKRNLKILAWSHLAWFVLMPEGLLTIITVAMAAMYFYILFNMKGHSFTQLPQVESQRKHWSVSLAKVMGVIFILVALIYSVFAIFVFGFTSNFIMMLFRLPFCMIFSIFGMPCE